MSKKKRQKKYTGWDAAPDESTVTIKKVAAVNRGNLAQWFHDHQKLVKWVLIILAVAVVIVLLFTLTV